MVERLSFKQKFIVFGVGLLSVLLLVFYGYSAFSSRDKIYHVNFKCSVNGLKEGSSVTYKGVEIGTVSAIRIELPDVDLVKVSIRVKHYFPVYSNYSAVLSSRGFTGYYTIDLNKEEGEQVEMVPGSFIQYKASSFEEILQNVPEVVKEAKIFLKNINKSLTEKDVKKIANCIDVLTKNVEEFSNNLKIISNKGKIESDHFFCSIRQSLQRVDGVLNKLIVDYRMIEIGFLSRLLSLNNLLDGFGSKVTKRSDSNMGVWKFFNL